MYEIFWENHCVWSRYYFVFYFMSKTRWFGACWKHCQWRTRFGNVTLVPGVFHGGVSRTGTLGRVRVVSLELISDPSRATRKIRVFFFPFLFNNTERLCICWDRSQSAHLLIIFNNAASLHSYCFSKANYGSSATPKWIIVIPAVCW